jgi:cytochrome c553
MGRREALLAVLLLAAAYHVAPAGTPVAGDADRGRARSEELYCAVCHGPLGVSTTPEWPSLAAQVPGYLMRQLYLFRSRERASLEMEPMAASLSDEDIADLAAFYAAQKPAPATDSACTPAAERLYRVGDREREIPACAECHGALAEGREATGDPALRGLHAAYTTRQLRAYASRTRYLAGGDAQRAPGAQAMQMVAGKLTSGEIDALASCLQRDESKPGSRKRG